MDNRPETRKPLQNIGTTINFRTSNNIYRHLQDTNITKVKCTI